MAETVWVALATQVARSSYSAASMDLPRIGGISKAPAKHTVLIRDDEKSLTAEIVGETEYQLERLSGQLEFISAGKKFIFPIKNISASKGGKTLSLYFDSIQSLKLNNKLRLINLTLLEKVYLAQKDKDGKLRLKMVKKPLAVWGVRELYYVKKSSPSGRPQAIAAPVPFAVVAATSTIVANKGLGQIKLAITAKANSETKKLPVDTVKLSVTGGQLEKASAAPLPKIQAGNIAISGQEVTAPPNHIVTLELSNLAHGIAVTIAPVGKLGNKEFKAKNITLKILEYKKK